MKKLSSPSASRGLEMLQYKIYFRVAMSIFFISATVFSTSSFSFNFFSSAYKVVFDESYGKGHGPQAVSLTSSSDGGYAFAGTWGAGFGAWLVKTDSKGQQQWEQVFNSRRASTQVGTVALTTKDHGYVLAGETNELDLLGARWDPIPDLSGSGGVLDRSLHWFRR